MESDLEIRERYLGGNDLEAYYFEKSGLRVMAIESSIEPERHRLWELVGHGMERVPSATRRLIGRSYPDTSGFYFFGASRERDADPLAVRAVFEVLHEMAPEWVSAVENARLVADSPQVLAAWSEVPIETVLAVLGDWRTRL